MVAAKKKKAKSSKSKVDNSVASRVGKYMCLHLTRAELQRLQKQYGISPSELKKLHATKNEVAKVLRKTYKSVPQEKADLVFKKFFNKLPGARAKPKPIL